MPYEIVNNDKPFVFTDVVLLYEACYLIFADVLIIR